MVACLSGLLGCQTPRNQLLALPYQKAAPVFYWSMTFAHEKSVENLMGLHLL